MVKIQRVAASGQQGVALLDSNGRLWRPNLMLGGGESNDWYCDMTVGAMAVEIDGRGTPWVINAEGRIFFEPPFAGMGASRQWQEFSLMDDERHLVKATQIAAGFNRIIAVDDQRRLWQSLPGRPEAAGIAWSIDAGASSVRCTTIGRGDNEIWYINVAGDMFRSGEDGWQKLSELSVFDDPPFDPKAAVNQPTPLTNLSTITKLAMRRAQPAEQDYFTGLFYLGSDGFIRERTAYGPWRGMFFKDPVGQGVDFAVGDLDNIWMVNAAGELWRRTQTAITSPLAIGSPVPAKVHADPFLWQRIKGPNFSKAPIYWIQPGDTFNKIAADLGTTPAALHAKNPQIADTNAIRAGDLLKLM